MCVPYMNATLRKDIDMTFYKKLSLFFLRNGIVFITNKSVKKKKITMILRHDSAMAIICIYNE